MMPGSQDKVWAAETVSGGPLHRLLDPAGPQAGSQQAQDRFLVSC